MNETLIVIGVVCIVAAIVGGGLKMAGAEIPPLRSVTRQLMLAAAGVLVLVVGVLLARDDDDGDGSAGAQERTSTATASATEQQTPGGERTIVIPPGEVAIRISRSEGAPGMSIFVSGGGFQPGETVEIRFHTERIGETRANINGRFSGVPVEIPADWPFKGQFDVIATGLQSIKSARQPFEVK